MGNSRRISVRTMKYGLIMEWTAKLCILLPFCLAGKTFGDAVMCLLLGGAVWGVAVTLMSAGMGQSRSVDRAAGLRKNADCLVGFGDLSSSAGRAAGFYGVAVLLFCAAQAAVFVRLGAELAARYLLPRTAASERAVEQLMLQNPSAGFAARHIPYPSAAGQTVGQMVTQASAAGQSASQMMTQAAAADVQHLVTRSSAAGFGTQVLPSQALIVALCLMVFAVAAYFALRRYGQEKIAEALHVSAGNQVMTDTGAAGNQVMADTGTAGKAFENSDESNHVQVRKNIWGERYGAGGLCAIAGAAVAGGMVLLAALCASGAASWTAGRTSVRDVDSIVRGSFEVFACLGGVSLPVLYQYMETGNEQGCSGCTACKSRRYQYIGTRNEQEGDFIRDNRKSAKSRGQVRQQALCAVRRAGRFSLVLSGFVCVAAVAFYGSVGAGSILFPAVSMMGELLLAGIFRQYVEQVFALLLFVCTVAAAASALYLMLRLTARLYPAVTVLLAGLHPEPDLPGVSTPKFSGMQLSDLSEAMPSGFSRAVRRFQWAALAVVCLASAGFSSGLTAVSYYRAWNMQLLVPLMLILYGWYCAARRCQRVRETLNRQPARL